MDHISDDRRCLFSSARHIRSPLCLRRQEAEPHLTDNRPYRGPMPLQHRVMKLHESIATRSCSHPFVDYEYNRETKPGQKTTVAGEGPKVDCTKVMSILFGMKNSSCYYFYSWLFSKLYVLCFAPNSVTWLEHLLVIVSRSKLRLCSILLVDRRRV